METEHDEPMKSLNELLWLFMRQAAIEGAAQRHPARRHEAPKVRSRSRRHKEAKAS